MFLRFGVDIHNRHIASDSAIFPGPTQTHIQHGDEKPDMEGRNTEILELLSDGPVPGPALAGELDLTRAALRKQIESLREGGFEISSSEEGYELKRVPEFSGEAIAFGLEAPYGIEYHDTIPSTNERARELAAEGEEDMVVVADSQSGGRGRLDRDWASPSGGIWLSILVRPALPAAEAPAITLATAVATARAIEAPGVDASIKWPNDVLVDGQKVAGILTEMEAEGDSVSWVVVGVGLNANVERESLPDDGAPTSLQSVAGPVNRREVTQRLLESFAELIEAPEEALSEWRDRSATLDRRVRVETPDGTVVGRATDIEFPGTLLLETEAGTRRITVGECEHLRDDSNTDSSS